MHNRIKHSVLCVGLLAYVVAVAFGSVDAVICYGSDGHVELEGISSQCCDHGDVADSVAVVTVYGGYDNSTNNDHNCRCTDIPVSTGKTEKYVTKTNDNYSELSIASQCLAFCLPEVSDGVKCPVLANLAFSHDKSLDTVILLI